MLNALKTKQINMGFKNFEILVVSDAIEAILQDCKKSVNTLQSKVANSIPTP